MSRYIIVNMFIKINQMKNSGQQIVSRSFISNIVQAKQYSV